ncbi:MAG: CYTH domain-containing protein [Pseudomonadota bacterium]|jgi:inorganic triphosphatase YgiF|uniref:CYTH domain-containing protein n=1 Tax=Methylophaga aminisulfidivorans TaxID=230105 RepID=UPI0024E2655B|nr:CYTH domain-containing protein [Methylophaga aminisulfidivorans]MEC9411869.1 CYTH domain-containing protein [Pseudomonadota bacterium]
MSLEQEIKLQVTQAESLLLHEIDWLKKRLIQDVYQQHLLSTYFDTADKALMNFGVGLRLRQIGEQWLQTVKCSGKASSGLHERQEWEHELEAPEFDLERLAETAIAPLLEQEQVWNAIQPVFTTEFERDVWLLRLEADTVVELAYDRGEVRAGDKQVAIHEIELELKQGQIDICQKLADQLKAALPLEYSNISKAGLGYGLSQGADK